MDLKTLLTALNNARNAGDTAAVGRLSAAIREMGANVPPPTAGQQGQGQGLAGAASNVGQGLFFGFGDELAGAAGAGANTIANLFGGGTDVPFSQAYEQIRDAARLNQQGFAERNPKTALALEIGSGIATGGAGLAKSGATQGLKGLARMGGIGAIEGAAYGTGLSEGETQEEVARDALQGMAMGGLLGAAVPAVTRGIGKYVKGRPALSVIDESYDESVGRLRREGMPLTSGQKIGSESWKLTEETLSNSPIMGGPLADVAERQGVKFQKKVMSMAGFDTKDVKRGLVDTRAIENAEDKFSRRYKDLLGDKKLNLANDDDFFKDLARVTLKNVELLEPMRKTQVQDIVKALRQRARKGPITGREYQRMRSRAAKLADGLEKQDWSNAELYKDITAALDDAFARAVPGGSKAIRKDYSRFKQVKDVWAKGSGQQVAQGLLPMRSLATAAKNKGAGYRDKAWHQFMEDAAKVLPANLNNSGTAGRQLGVKTLLGGNVGTMLGGRALAEALAEGGLTGLLSAPSRIRYPVGSNIYRLGQQPLGLLANPAYQLTYGSQ